MSDYEEEFEEFKKFWEKTEIIREYARALYTFSGMKLPYIFAAEHHIEDRTVIRRGIVEFERPQIILPGYYRGPDFLQGFNNIPSRAIHLFREMGLPYSYVANRIIAREEIEYGGLQSVLNKFSKKLEREEDEETGLIKGLLEGMEASLVRYSVGLFIKSVPENVREFFEHRKKKRGPIRPDEKITDEEIKKLFEQD